MSMVISLILRYFLSSCGKRFGSDQNLVYSYPLNVFKPPYKIKTSKRIASIACPKNVKFLACSNYARVQIMRLCNYARAPVINV